MNTAIVKKRLGAFIRRHLTIHKYSKTAIRINSVRRVIREHTTESLVARTWQAFRNRNLYNLCMTTDHWLPNRLYELWTWKNRGFKPAKHPIDMERRRQINEFHRFERMNTPEAADHFRKVDAEMRAWPD